MKGRIRTFYAVFLVLFLSVPVWGDVGSGQMTDYHTDYYMMVESKNGGIHIYADADQSSSRLNKKMILNGTSLHIKGEKGDESGNAWGLTEYHGMNGFVRLDELKPVTLSEAIQSEFPDERMKDVNYDYVISSKEGWGKVYRGPGKKFGEIAGITIKQGETVHISKEVLAEDENLWGKVTEEEKNGWIKIDKNKEPGGTPVPEKSPEITKLPESEKRQECTEGGEQVKIREETKEASVQAVDGVSELFMNPVLWIVAAGMFLVLIFLYFLKLK